MVVVAFCVTIPSGLLEVPKVTVPLLAVILPNWVVLPLIICTALAVLFVVVIVPVLKFMAPLPPLTAMVPLPEFNVVPVFCVKPTLLKLMLPLPLLELRLPVTVKAVLSCTVKLPFVVVMAPKFVMLFVLLPKFKLVS